MKKKEFVQHGCKIRVERTSQGALKYFYFCAKCGRSIKEAKFLSEKGYYERITTYKCPCGNIYRIYS